MGRVEVPRCDIEGMEYYKIPRDIFESAFRTARNPTAAAKRIAAVVEYAFTGKAELLQNYNDSAAFLLQFCSRIDRSRSNVSAAISKAKRKRSSAETVESEMADLRTSRPSDLPTDKRLEIREKRELLTLTSASGEPENRQPIKGHGWDAVYRGKRLTPHRVFEASPLSENPPTVEEIVAYGDSKGFEAFTGEGAREEAQRLIDYNERHGWKTPNGEPITDYRGLVRLWNESAEGFGAN